MNWKSEVKDRFSRKQEAPRWDKMYGEDTKSLADEHFRARRDFTVDYILARFDTSVAVCDLGCGAGPVTLELARKGYGVVGVDYSFDMLENAQRRLADGGFGGCLLINGNGEQLPFRDEGFELIVCLGVISYIENYEDVIQEVGRILKPGGTLIISYRNRYNLLCNDPVRLLKDLLGGLLVALRLRQPERFKSGRHMRAGEVTRVAEGRGFAFRGFKGIGFGPFGFWGKKYFGEEGAIAFSAKLTMLFDRLNLQFPYRTAADVHVLIFEKNGGGS